MHPEWFLDDDMRGVGYNIGDLENGIAYCREYIDAGYTHEAMDGFDLKQYIIWAEKEIEILRTQFHSQIIQN